MACVCIRRDRRALLCFQVSFLNKPARHLTASSDRVRLIDHSIRASLDTRQEHQQQQHGMRTEMVIRMGSDKGQQGARAMKVAAAVAGVESVALAGKDKSLLRVVGDGVDCNDLTTRLRRKVGRADLVELRTLHGAGAGSAGYYGSRTGSGLSRVDSGYGASSSYGGSYPATAATGGYAPEYYYGQPASSYGYYPPAAYAAAPTVVHHEYYPPSSTDPNSCSIM